MKIAAIFDLDHTLIPINSGLWAGYDLYRRSKLDLSGMIQFLGAAIAYRFAHIDFDKLVEKAQEHFVLIAKEELKLWGNDLFDRYFIKKIFKDAKTVLADHQKQGHCLVLATSSIQEIAMPFAKLLGIEHVIANELVQTADLKSYRLIKPYCFGQGKLLRVTSWSKQNNVDLEQSYFYSDSMADLPLLKTVGFARPVNPDWRLKLYAKSKKWPILHWR